MDSHRSPGAVSRSSVLPGPSERPKAISSVAANGRTTPIPYRPRTSILRSFAATDRACPRNVTVSPPARPPGARGPGPRRERPPDQEPGAGGARPSTGGGGGPAPAPPRGRGRRDPPVPPPRRPAGEPGVWLVQRWEFESGEKSPDLY